MPTSREQLKLRTTNMAEVGESTINETMDDTPQEPLPGGPKSSKTEKMPGIGTATPKYIKPRKPADPFLRPKRASTGATRSLNNKKSDSSPLDLISPSTDKSPASALATLLSQTSLKDDCQPCSQCEASRAALKSSCDQKDIQEIKHKLELNDAEKEHLEKAVLWEEERNKLLEEVSKAAIQSDICEQLHMSRSEHETVVGDLDTEVEAVYEKNWALECQVEELKDRLMKYEPDFVKDFEAKQTQVEDSVPESTSVQIKAGDVDLSSPSN